MCDLASANTERADIKLLFFAKARELCALQETRLSVPVQTTTAALRQAILERFPQLVVIEKNFILALDQEYLDENATVQIRNESELAVIPPLSGG